MTSNSSSKTDIKTLNAWCDKFPSIEQHFKSGRLNLDDKNRVCNSDGKPIELWSFDEGLPSWWNALAWEWRLLLKDRMREAGVNVGNALMYWVAGLKPRVVNQMMQFWGDPKKKEQWEADNEYLYNLIMGFLDKHPRREWFFSQRKIIKVKKIINKPVYKPREAQPISKVLDELPF